MVTMYSTVSRASYTLSHCDAGPRGAAHALGAVPTLSYATAPDGPLTGVFPSFLIELPSFLHPLVTHAIINLETL